MASFFSVCLSYSYFPLTVVTASRDSNYTLFLLMLVYCILTFETENKTERMLHPSNIASDETKCSDFIGANKEINFNKKNLFLWFLALILVCFSRKNGFHIALITSIALIFYFAVAARKNIKTKKIIIFFIVTFSAFSIFVLSELGTKYIFKIPDNNTREAASIMFQQTARYVWKYKQEVTEEEAETINKVLDYDNLAMLYNPELSDNVKNTFKKETGNEYFKDYIVVWFKHFIRHPLVYADAFLNNMCGYFRPGNDGIYSMQREFDTFVYPKYNVYISPPFADFFSPAEFAEACLDLKYVPVLGMFFRLGSYVWVLLFIMLYYILFKRDKKYIICCLPALLTLLICCVSPVNNCLRYGFPIVFSVPILLCFCFDNKNAQDKNVR